MIKRLLFVAHPNSKLVAEILPYFPNEAIIDCVTVPAGSSMQTYLAALQAKAAEQDIIIIDDHLQDDTPSKFGFGYRLTKALRLQTFLAGQVNTLRKLPLVIIGRLRLEQYLVRQPEHVFVLSPGITYISYLDRFPFIPDYPPAYRLSPKELAEIPAYLTQSFFQAIDRRHQAASTYSIFIIRSFLQTLNTHLAIPPDWAPAELFLEHPLYLASDSPLNEYLYVFQHYRQGFKKKISDEKDELLSLIQQVHHNLKQGQQKIGLVDDEANRLRHSPNHSLGWRHAIAALCFQPIEQVVDLWELSASENAPSEEIRFKRIGDLVESQSLACLLLDIYLQPDGTQAGGIENKSGTRLLRYLRQRFPTLPLLVITASNKPWKHRYLRSCGADAIWVKEGFDEGRSPVRSYYNIYRFLRLLAVLTNAKYQFLNQLGQHIQRLCDPNQTYWWSEAEVIWSGGRVARHKLKASHTPDFRGNISDLLTQILRLVRNFLNATTLEFYEGSGSNQAKRRVAERDFQQRLEDSTSVHFLASTIVITIGKIVEAIHGQQTVDLPTQQRINAFLIGGGYDTEKGQVVINRADWIGYWLFQHRNECAHYYFAKQDYAFFQEKDNSKGSLAHLLAALIAYLDNETIPYHDPSPAWYQNCRRGTKRWQRKVNPDFLKHYLRANKAKPGMTSIRTTYLELLATLSE